MHPFLNTAVKAARAAGDIITQYVDRIDRVKITEKQQNDFVTHVDVASENCIKDIILKAYPDHAILGEESGLQNTENNSDDNCWIIDPLDGTLNFIHGFPHFCVSIAMTHKNRLELGVIYDPIRQDLFIAERGSGAQKNERRIRVSARTKLEQCVIATGFPKGKQKNPDQFFKYLRYFSANSSGIRRTGSAALNLAYIACGQLDGYWEASLKPWDIAAGALMIKEAGGLISDFNGGEDFLTSGNIVCGNPKIFKQLLQVVGENPA
ncbi:MAG: inositol monophosphatase family protein [Pseudomonadota bacterium]